MAEVYHIPYGFRRAIFCSKIYQTSSRKEKINAEFENPINAELVKQINEYVGDEYKQQKCEVEDSDLKSHNSESEPESTSNSTDSNPNITPDSESSKLSEKYGDELDEVGEVVSNIVQTSETDASDHSIDSSITTPKTHIVADTIANKPFVETHITLNGLANEIKGVLNSKMDTQGVVRIAIKNDEMWIYYNDEINLNNVMSLVIELLNAMNYHYLIFNRLARTDNAIVFTINANDTLNIMGVSNNET